MVRGRQHIRAVSIPCASEGNCHLVTNIYKTTVIPLPLYFAVRHPGTPLSHSEAASYPEELFKKDEEVLAKVLYAVPPLELYEIREKNNQSFSVNETADMTHSPHLIFECGAASSDSRSSQQRKSCAGICERLSISRRATLREANYAEK
ncbi:hypothetical protein KIN20_011912 [Parelaphostrongylus tenuis]|uniref:Uncharacterized protein n=1 Tax=Parelaphostrongylus tenuis TaxID=148309 RepID=A0AAD5MSQ1_PARTN|nr:hypothetical protein KIN20_011912 [Parelaphostrongylus tenuis]